MCLGGCQSAPGSALERKLLKSHDPQTRRQGPPRPTFIKPEQRKLPGVQFTRKNAGDQEAGDDKKDIYANVATRHLRDACMKQDHRQDCHGTKTIYFRPILHVYTQLPPLSVSENLKIIPINVTDNFFHFRSDILIQIGLWFPYMRQIDGHFEFLCQCSRIFSQTFKAP